ncbi:MAG: xanthine dehydrogenase family protein molybdopterin-binding subunit [Rhizobiales bacterium]|nr:xanthine dehydrogenase family protein molybdopterin-binding subunit [Hyphomicrobiales bacterium]MBO6698756.1 xanthine dehydrogenase family protein molybdopterin-binding subunit [Hyphomicrobiales bacterium]MBO6734991.1 xanthine dehydrogenase family protein molybdopterin-binding subunit [Hyphomicrobiales bacterium]MBO6911203.1 xanthine dehydrogenase family protein molybdopterin-binding subunit [Hyphomicrobiales bacterium]MBO6955793.1 xanthine dehydrogenase family protein molybdopterin-binding 
MANTFEFRKEFFADERDENLNEIGKRIRRQDIEGHVTGRSPFYDDHLFDGLLHMRYVRSPHHHARIRRIDTSRAENMPGVVRIITGADVPVNLNTLLALLDFGLDDEPVLSDKKVAYVGEPVAAVVAHTEAEARAAVKEVHVDWEVLPHVHDVEEALKPGAPTVCDVYPGNAFVYHGKYDHQKLRFGDVDAAFKTADHIVETRHQMSPIEQAPIETCGAISAPEQNGRYVCYTGTQALFFSLGTASKVLNEPSSRLHFIGGTVGGGFGGKVDSIHEPLSILGAMLTGKPCKSQWDREEEMQVGAPRGAERWYITDGVMNDGRIVARKFRGYFDCGAYTRLSSYAVIKSVGHLPGPYTIPNVYADVYCVYTNRTPATAMRGFGITGVDFSIEAHMDQVADTIGMNPIDLRILNAYRDGDMKAHRRVAKNCAFIECCQVVAEKAGLTIKPESKAASSLRDGGGVRGQIPAHTAIDHDGAVEGFESTSYARKGGSSPTTGSVPSTPSSVPAQQAPVQPSSYQPVPQSTPAPQPAPVQPAPAAPPAAGQQPRKRASTRFSSISGFRRR